MSPRRLHGSRRSRQRGVLLGIVLILLAVLFAAGIFALWSMRSDTGAAGRDRLSRQLFDCAEMGLADGKQYFAKSLATISTYLAANVCSASTDSTRGIGPLPCWSAGGPFPTGGTAVAGYPNSSTFTKPIQMNASLAGTSNYDFEYTFWVYNDPGDSGGYYADSNNKVIIYSRCTDLATLQQRSVQAVISITQSTSTDYTGQAGRGFRNQGNQNF
jgi:hypothetical protein